jgi:hypothetical protein
MAGRDSANKQSRNGTARRCGVVMGGALGAFVAAAAMATGSAAPAKADFEDLLDPIIQPLLTSVSDSLSTVDPTLAVDLTSWTDSLLASLNSIDVAVPAASEPAASAASSAEPASAAALSNVSIPITVAEDTESTVQSTVDGASTTLLVDSGSSGLVIPDTDLGSNFFTQLEALFSLGTPTGISEGGYSGGVEYIYLTYNDVPVDYTSTTGAAVDTTAPVEVEVYSWDPSDLSSLFTNDAFQNFDTDNAVTGILGIGTTGTGGAGESPIEAAGYQGVTVDDVGAHPELTLDATPNTTGTDLTATGSTVSGLTESVTTGADGTGTSLGTGSVSDDLDSGGVYGTIPTSISSADVPQGDYVNVYDGNTLLYSYQVETDTLGTNESPTAVSGTSIDSGVIPFEQYPISIDYSNNDIYLDN